MKKLLSLFFNQKNTNKVPKSESRFVEGWEAYQQAKKLFFTKDKTNEQVLLLFDKAIECKIMDAYGDRAFCLQGLEFHYDAISDFDEAISFCSDDANLYFGRGHSKKIIADYEGSISDLKKAVELSQVDNKLNAEYNDEIRKQGWTSAAQYYRFQLQDAIDRKESCQKENLKKLYTQIAKEVKRRQTSNS